MDKAINALVVLFIGIAILGSVLAFPSISWSQSRAPLPAIANAFSEDMQAAFQAIVDDEFSFATQKAGMSVAVYSGNKLWTYATGIADSGIDMTVDTPIPIGSTSKTFMSGLVLSQIEAGLYNLTDSLEAVLSGHPAYTSFDLEKINPQVSVEQLLSMRSGLPHYHKNIEGKATFFKKANPWKPSDNVNLVQSSYTEPGAFDYNDTNLVLLGLIAEFQSGQSLYDLYKQQFFDPLGVTVWFPPQDAVPSDVARPHGNLSPWADGFGNLIDAAPYTFDFFWVGQSRIRYPCCGLISTPKDTARWAYELYSSNGSAISALARTRLLKSLSNDPVHFAGMQRYYGYLVTKQTSSPLSSATVTIGHPGGGAGYVSLLRYSPDLDLAVSVLQNSLWRGPGKCAAKGQRIVIDRCIVSRIFSAYAQ